MLFNSWISKSAIKGYFLSKRFAGYKRGNWFRLSKF